MFFSNAVPGYMESSSVLAKKGGPFVAYGSFGRVHMKIAFFPNCSYMACLPRSHMK